MTKSTIIKNYLYNVLYQILSIIIPLITTPYISRVLKVESIGAYGYTASIVSYFTLFGGLGLSMYGQREIAYYQNNKQQRSKIFGEVCLFRLLTVSITFIIYVLFILNVQNQQYRMLFQIQIISIVSVLFDISWFFQGLEEFKRIVFRNLFVKVVGALCIFCFVHSEENLWLYTLILVGSNFIGNISLWLYLPKYICAINIKELRPFRNINTVFQLFVPMIATTVYNVLDKTMIGIITCSDAENGYYEQTTKIISVVLALLTSLGTVLLPRMANCYVNNKVREFRELVNTSYRFVIWASCPFCFGIIAISSCLVPWFLGAGFEKVSVLIKIYAPVLLFIPISNIAGAAVLTPTGRQNKGTIAVFIGAGVNFILNLVLIRHLSSIGAAIATIIAEFVVTVLHIYYIRNDVDIKSLMVFWIKHLFISILMLVFIYVITARLLSILNISMIVTNVIQIFAGIGLYLFLSIIVLREKNLIKDTLRVMRQ